jgi:hypothetical protein
LADLTPALLGRSNPDRLLSEHGAVAVPDDQLPVLLPDDVEWLPTGESPLKLHPNWKYTTCPVCGVPAERETDTMDTFMDSSWYHLRYLSPHYDQGPFDEKEYNYWMPVDTYTGGIEHATMHLIYTRFFHKACRDMGITEGPEPMIQLRSQGIILGEDSEKMSKEQGKCSGAGCPGQPVWSRYRSGLPDVLCPLGYGSALEQQRYRRHGALAASCVGFDDRFQWQRWARRTGLTLPTP